MFVYSEQLGLPFAWQQEAGVNYVPVNISGNTPDANIGCGHRRHLASFPGMKEGEEPLLHAWERG